jgi:site-specific DNA recombinase
MPADLVSRPVDPDKAAIYIRWSTDDQADGTTLDVQMEGCRHFVLSQGWRVSNDLLFIDDGYSGGSLDRPALSRLRRAVQEGRVECVVVFKLDRLSRSVVDTVNLVLREWNGRCDVKSAREPIDTSTQAGKMFFYMLVSYAEWERGVIRDRTWSGKLRRAQEGRNPGIVPPYGYAAGQQPGSFAVVEAEAAVVRRIFRLYTGGLGTRAIAGALNRDGLRTRASRLWAESSVRHILQNRAYAGELVWGNVARVQGVFPLIINELDFAAAQQVRAGRPSPRRGGSGRSVASRYLVSGIARCRCGASLIGREGTGRGDRTYYICAGKHGKGSSHCGSGYVVATLLEEAVAGTLRTLFGRKLKRETALAESLRRCEERLREARSLLREASRERSRLLDQQRNLRRQYREGRLTIEEYRDLRSDLDAELSALAGRHAELERESRATGELAADRTRWEQLAVGADEWAILSAAERKHLVRQFARSVRVWSAPRSRHLECEIWWAVASEATLAGLQTHGIESS